jgi:hypothetical protein
MGCPINLIVKRNHAGELLYGSNYTHPFWNREIMSSDSGRVTALIRELLILNRAESAPRLEPVTVKEIEGQESKRKRIRQELVRVLGPSR